MQSLIVVGCGTVSSSSAPVVAVNEQVTGPIYITTDSLPADVDYIIIGTIKANARVGYDSAESLYPLLANEARKTGANAVIQVYNGRTVSAFSWGAPYTGGTAIKIKNIEDIKKYGGRYY